MSDQSESIGKLVTALVNVQGEIKAAKKEAENPFFHSKYADLGSIWESCRALLNKNGLAVIQTTKVMGPDVALVSTLAHTSGEWIKGELLLIPVKRDPQGIGSAITYARRYALAALLGIVADEDDDGNAASDIRNHQTPVKSHPTPLPDVVSDAHSETLHTSCFELSEPIPSKNKPGKFYRKAMDLDGASFYVHSDHVAADLNVAAGKEVTVKLQTNGKFTSISEVMQDANKPVPF